VAASDDELAPGAKITVLATAWLDGARAIGPSRERVLRVAGELVMFDAGFNGQAVRRDAEGTAWCLGWDDEDAAALSATARLLAGAA
jgi:hypothetical protein